MTSPKSLARLTAELIAEEFISATFDELISLGYGNAEALVNRIEDILSRRLVCADKLKLEIKQ